MLKSTHQSLLEQMRISDAEIFRRLELVGFHGEQATALKAVLHLIDEKVDVIVEAFYESQLAVDEIAMLIGDSDTLSRLKTAQRQYILDLFKGKYDSGYVNNRLRIGLVHKRIGVEPKLYLSGINTLKELLFRELKMRVQEEDKQADVIDALDRLLYFDTTLVFDTYIASLLREVDAAKRKTEEYANSLEIKVAERTAQLEELSHHDPLTGLYNQNEMRHMLRHELIDVKRRKMNLAVIYLDIDKFKAINDKQGHIKGDEILKGLSKAITESIREGDVACRYGGDEFCIICPDANLTQAVEISTRLIENFEHKYPKTTLSIGIVDTDAKTLLDEDQLIFIADKRMYIAKKQEGSYICSDESICI